MEQCGHVSSVSEPVRHSARVHQHHSSSLVPLIVLFVFNWFSGVQFLDVSLEIQKANSIEKVIVVLPCHHDAGCVDYSCVPGLPTVLLQGDP